MSFSTDLKIAPKSTGGLDLSKTNFDYGPSYFIVVRRRKNVEVREV